MCHQPMVTCLIKIPLIQKQNEQEICLVTGVQLMCQNIMNELRTDEGQQRSGVIRQSFLTAQRFQIQLLIQELSDLGHRIGSFGTTKCMQK